MEGSSCRHVAGHLVDTEAWSSASRWKSTPWERVPWPFCEVRRTPRTEPLRALTFQGWTEEAEPTEETEQVQLESEGKQGGETL